MASQFPPGYDQPIPNNPFYSPDTNYIKGEYGPFIVGSGIFIDNSTGTISAGGSGPGGITTLLSGAGITVSPNVGGIVTVSNTGVLTLIAGNGINITNVGGAYTITNSSPAAGSTGTVTSITAGPGLLGGTITTSGTIALEPSGVSANTYTNATISVDQYGRVIFATNGTPSGALGILATAPLQVTTGVFPQTISISAASTSASGAVRLNDTVTSTSTTQAATARSVKEAYDIAVLACGTAFSSSASATTALTNANNACAIATTAQTCALQALTEVAIAQGDATQALADAADAQTTAGDALLLAITSCSTANIALASANNRIPCSAFLGKGNLLVGTSSGAYGNLSPGTSGQYLIANPAAPTGLSWAPSPVNGLIVAKGDLIVGLGPSTPSILGVGGNGQVLTACSACPSGITWAASAVPAIPCSCIIGKGGLITGTGPGAPVALPVGPNGYYLTANSACTSGLAWTALQPPAGATAPASPTVGALWYDTSSSPDTLKAWDGTSWVPVTYSGSSIPPSTPLVGQTWSDTSVSPPELKVWDGTSWEGVGAGTVTSVATGTGLTGGPITSSGTIALANTAVTPGSYTNASITVDAQGRLTAASSGIGGVSAVTGVAPIVSTGGSTPAISLANTAVTPGSYTYGSFTVDAKGRLTAASSGAAPVTSVTGTAPIISSGGSTPNITLANTLVTPGSYTYSAITVDAQGRLTAASSGTAPVTSITAGTGLTGGTITSSGTIALADTAVAPGTYNYGTFTVDQQGRLTFAASGTAPNTTVTAPITNTGTAVAPILGLANTAVTPGSYTYGSFTVDAKGRLTAASNGTAPNTTVTSPITNAGTAVQPVIGVQTATTGQLGVVQVGTNIDVTSGVISVATSSTTQSGIVQLNDTVTSTSTTEALTAAQGKNLQDQISTLLLTSNLTLAGTFDATTGLMLTATSAGAAEGFNVGFNLPAATVANTDYFVIVTTPGSYSPPGGGGPYSATQGDWFLSNGTAWQFLNVGLDLPIASTGTQGIVQLATTAQTQAGTSTTLAITPSGAAATYVPIACLTGKGAILTATAANTPTALPVGTNGQILYANSACATGLCWGTRPITQNDFDAVGDLLVGAGSDAFATLAVGTNGQYLTACSAAANGICWTTPVAAIPCACITAVGDLLVGSAASTPVALPVGANGLILTANSACPLGMTWASGNAGTVTSVGTGTGLTGGPITSTGTICLANTTVAAGAYTYGSFTVDAQGRLTAASSGTAPNTTVTAPITNTGTAIEPVLGLANTAVTPGSYTYGSFTVDAQGRLTAASSGTSPVTSITAGTGLDGGTITSTGTIDLADTAVTPGSYTYTALTVDQQGRITAASSGTAPNTTVTAPITNTGTATEPVIGLADTAVTPGSYTYANITVDAQGRLTAAASGTPPTGGTVTSITAGTGLDGGTITTSGTIDLADTAVTPGAYTYGSFTVDQQGRLTAAADGVAPNTTVTAPITNTGTAIEPVIGLANTAVTPGSYTYSSFTVDAQGRLTAASSGTAPNTTVTAPITNSGTATEPVIGLANTSVTPGTYTYASFTVDAQGRLIDAYSETSPVTSITAGTGLTGGTITSTGTIDLANTAVTPGSYTYASITVDAQGRLTAASSGAPAVTAVTGTGPISVTAGLTPVVSIAASSTTGSGAVQLYDDVNSTSTSLALTANQGRLLQEQITQLLTTPGIEFAGTIDASTGLVASVTSVGSAALYTVGSSLPAASATTVDTYVIVTTPGTFTPPGGSPTTAGDGDWFLVSEVSAGVYSWQFLNVGFDAPAATTTTQGVVCLSTSAIAQAGTDTTTALTPAAAASAYVPLAGYTAKGVVLAATGANTPTALSVGTDGQVLTACSTASTGLCWNTPVPAIPCSCILAKGDIIIGTAANTPVALPVGANGQVLYANSACATGLCWATPMMACATPITLGSVYGCQRLNGVTSYGQCAALSGGGLATSAYGFQASQNQIVGAFGNTSIGFRSQQLLTTGGYNSSLGVNTLQKIVTQNNNTAIGAQTLTCTTGDANTAVGYYGLGTLGAGFGNVGVGALSGICLTTGDYNVGIGYCATFPNTTGSCQLVIGYCSGCNWLTGCSDKSIQPGAGIRDCAGNLGTAGQVLLSTGSNAVCWGSSVIPPATPTTLGLVYGCTHLSSSPGGVALGFNALCSGGAQNTVAIGAGALCSSTTGCNNVAIGTSAGQQNVSGKDNVFIGTASGVLNTGGSGNVMIGACAGCLGIPAALSCCLVIGAQGYVTWITGNNTGAIKPAASFIDCLGSCGTAGQVLTSTGANSLCWRTLPQATPTAYGTVLGCTNSSNTYLGCCAGLSTTTGGPNVAIGINALRSNTTFGANTAIGYSALEKFNGGTNGANDAFGMFALCGLTAGEYNVAVGGWSFFSATSGCNNTGIGHRALNGLTSACTNTALGFYAGCNITTGSCNVAIGPYTAVASPTASCQLVIGWCQTCNWITGDCNKNVQFGAGIKDCFGTLGGPGQILSSTGTAIQWTNNGKMVGGFVNDVGTAGQWLEIDGIQFGMWTGCRSFVMRPVSGTLTASWSSCYQGGTVGFAAASYQDLATISPNWRFLIANANFPAHATVQQATICVAASGGFTRAMYQFCGIVGSGYCGNGISITRIA